MIFGRPTNLWLAAGTALVNLAFLVSGQVGYPVSAELVAAANLALAALITLVAGQPPVLSDGATYKVSSADAGVVTKQANTNLAAVAPVSGNGT